MPTYPIGPYAPDLISIDSTASPSVKNVIPTASGWGPMAKFDQTGDALTAPCRGAIMTRNADGSFTVFAGTHSRLFMRVGSSWTSVTRLAGGDYTLPEGHTWDFEQFGQTLVAVNINDAPQAFTLGSSTEFAALAGNPPNARFVYQESGYLGLAHLSNAERTLRRSGLNDATFHTLGLNGADDQELVDGGNISGASGDSSGAYIFCTDKVHRLQNQPGQQIGFSLADIEPERGCTVPESIVRVGNMVFFLTDEGFFQLGSPSSPIGSQIIDRTFLEDVNLSAPNQIQGVNDERRKMVWWRYASHSVDGAYSDKLIGYHWQLQRWTYAEVDLEFLLEVATPGYSLEDVTSLLGYTDLESVPYSFDSAFWEGGIPTLGGFNTNHKLGFFSGPNIEATLFTSDIPIGGERRRCFVRGFTPITDAGDVFGATLVKEKLSREPRLTPEQPQNGINNFIPQRASGRFARFRCRIPAETMWNNFSGIEVDAQPTGRR